MDLAVLKADLDALRRARTTGAREIKYVGNGVERSTSFKSDAEMARAIASLEEQIGRAEGSTPVRNIVLRTVEGKGW